MYRSYCRFPELQPFLPPCSPRLAVLLLSGRPPENGSGSPFLSFCCAYTDVCSLFLFYKRRFRAQQGKFPTHFAHSDTTTSIIIIPSMNQNCNRIIAQNTSPDSVHNVIFCCEIAVESTFYFHFRCQLSQKKPFAVCFSAPWTGKRIPESGFSRNGVHSPAEDFCTKALAYPEKVCYNGGGASQNRFSVGKSGELCGKVIL